MYAQFLFVEKFVRIKRNKYSDYGKSRPYEIRDGKLYELYSYNNQVSSGTAQVDGTMVFENIKIIDDFNFSATFKREGYGEIKWFLKKITD